MFALKSGAPVAPRPAHIEPKRVHLMLVRTPQLTLRGLVWLQRSESAGFDGLELQRLIRAEKLSLG